MKKRINLKVDTKKESILVLFIVYIFHLVFMIFVNNKTLITDNKILQYVFIFRIHRWMLSFPIIYYFVKTYKKYKYFKTDERLNIRNFSIYFALAFWVGNIFHILTTLTFKFKERTTLVEGPLYIDIIMTLCVAPILEEMVFRGVIMNNLKKYGIKTAIIVNSILFGVSHSNINMIIPAILTGIIFSYTAYKYSLKYSILLHFLLNTLTKISQVIIFSKIEILIVSIGLFFIFLVIFLLIFLVIGLGKGKYKEMFSILKLDIEDRKSLVTFTKNNLLYLFVILVIVISNLLFNYKLF
ncbi:lysostaphin resistance A-like protein [Leptotrichia sp. HSP-334]|uniref:Lysostaphin resistance A-like protein n=1 Tax=Leptotrichia rugosa TaxID=3239302 RepID=A0AB39VK64_9FUSO